MLGGIAYSAARGWHEGPNTNIHAESAFDDCCDRTHYGRFLGEGLLERRPVCRLRNLLAGEFVVALGIAPFDRDRHLVARLHGLTGALEYGQRHDAFSLESDIKENGFRGDCDDRPFELFSAAFLLADMGFLVLGKNVFERLGGFGDGKRL